MQGMRIATSATFSDLLAMTVVFDNFRTQMGTNRNKKYVIANQCAHWCGNPFPSMRSIVSPRRGDNVTPINDNLQFKE